MNRTHALLMMAFLAISANMAYAQFNCTNHALNQPWNQWNLIGDPGWLNQSMNHSNTTNLSFCPGFQQGAPTCCNYTAFNTLKTKFMTSFNASIAARVAEEAKFEGYRTYVRDNLDALLTIQAKEWAVKVDAVLASNEFSNFSNSVIAKWAEDAGNCTAGLYYNGSDCLQCMMNNKTNGTFSPDGSKMCMNCSTADFWNYTKVACQNCPGGWMYDHTNLNCTTCTEGRYYHRVNRTNGTCNYCQNSADFWNPTTNKCQNCSLNVGNVNTNMTNMWYDRATETCMTCPNGQWRNITTGTCKNCSKSDFFDTKKQKCGNCPEGFRYNYTTNSCGTCPLYQKFNRTGRFGEGNCMENCSSTIDSQFWNSTTNMCMNCTGHLNEKDFFNTTDATCRTCPNGQYTWHSNMTCLECQTGDYWWTNATYGMCMNCSDSTYFNATANACVACPGGDRYNRTGIRNGTCLNYTMDTGKTSVKDYWHYSTDPQQNQWRNCENNTRFDKSLATQNVNDIKYYRQVQACKNCPNTGGFFNRTGMSCTTCQSNQYWWNTTSECVTCPFEEYWNMTANTPYTGGQCQNCSDPMRPNGTVDMQKHSGFNPNIGTGGGCYICNNTDKYSYNQTSGKGFCVNCVDNFKYSYQFWNKTNQTCESCGTGFIFQKNATQCTTCASDAVGLASFCCTFNPDQSKYMWNASFDLDCGACQNDNASLTACANKNGRLLDDYVLPKSSSRILEEPVQNKNFLNFDREIAQLKDLQMINTHLRIMSDTHRILANDTDYTVPNTSKLNWNHAPYYWPDLYSSLFTLEGLSYDDDAANIAKNYGEMFCNAYPQPMRNNSKEYPYNCNSSSFTWNVTNETITMKKSLKDKALVGLSKLQFFKNRAFEAQKMCLETVYSSASALACKVCDANQSSFMTQYGNKSYINLDIHQQNTTNYMCYPYVYYMYQLGVAQAQLGDFKAYVESGYLQINAFKNLSTSLRSMQDMNLDSPALQALWDKNMVLWNKTVDAKNQSYGVVDKNAEARQFQNDYFNQPYKSISNPCYDFGVGNDRCPFLNTFNNINFVNFTVYNLFGLRPKNFSMSDSFQAKMNATLNLEKWQINDVNKSLTFLNFGNNTPNLTQTTRLLQRQLQENQTNYTLPTTFGVSYYNENTKPASVEQFNPLTDPNAITFVNTSYTIESFGNSSYEKDKKAVDDVNENKTRAPNESADTGGDTPTPTPAPADEPANMMWVWIILAIVGIVVVLAVCGCIAGNRNKEDHVDPHQMTTTH